MKQCMSTADMITQTRRNRCLCRTIRHHQMRFLPGGRVGACFQKSYKQMLPVSQLSPTCGYV
jgi:hypothetical protein